MSELMNTPLPMAAVIRLEFEPVWLGLSRDARRTFADEISGILGRHTDIEMTWFDDLEAYHFLWEELKDTELFSKPYLRIVDVTLGFERGYEAFEAQSTQ